MKKIIFGYFCLLLFFLSSCSLNAPTNKDFKDMIYGIYLKDAVIIRKELCQDTDANQSISLWLVHFVYKDDNKPYGYLIEEMPDGTLTPLRIPSLNATCP